MTSALPGPDQWPEISGLLDELLALQPGERDAWLAALARERPSHHAALRPLLETLGEIEDDDFLEELPRLDVPDGAATTQPHPGGMVSVYRLLHEIGVGGMGTVWLAERPDGVVQRRVALKLPRAAWSGSFSGRLVRESRILATLEHEHIARLYDAGVDAQGRPFLALEYVEGLPIDVYCRDNALPVRERVALLLQTMAAVSHAHARLVVHRDLKPANILVTREGRVKLLDFGIAKLLEADRTDATALTHLAGRALTLDYASPEQIRGEPLGTASDVYSLGVVAYELLSDAKPYRLRRGTAGEMEQAIAEATPALASAAATSPERRNALRGDLDAILNRALKKAVDERYPSVDAFAQDLERHLRGEPVQARPDSRWYRVSKFVSRHRLAVTLGTTLAIAVIAGGGVALWQAHVAELEQNRALYEAARQKAVRDLYDETMMALSVTAREHPEAFAKPRLITQTLQDTLHQMAGRYRTRPIERAAQFDAVMLQLNYDSEFEASLAVGEEYLAHLKQTLANEENAVLFITPDQVITAYAVMGRDLGNLGRLDESEAARRAGFDWAPAASDERTALARLGIASDLADVLSRLGKRAEALRVLTRAEAIAAAQRPGHASRFENGLVLSAYYAGFDDVAALQAAQRSYDGLQAVATRDPSDRAAYARSYGAALVNAGLAARAEPVLRESQALFADAYGRSSGNAVTAAGRTAESVSLQGDYARAARLLDEAAQPAGSAPLSAYAQRRVLERRLENAWLAGDVATLRTLVPATIDIGATVVPARLRADLPLLQYEALALTQLGRSADALALLQALRARWPMPDRATATWVDILGSTATAQLAAGHPQDARATARASTALFAQAQAPTGRGALDAAELEALASARLGDTTDAARALQRAESVQPPPPFRSAVAQADSLLRRSEVLARLGRSADAAAKGREALALLGGQSAESPRLAAARAAAAGAASASSVVDSKQPLAAASNAH